MKKYTRLKALLLGCVCALTTAFSAVPARADTIVASQDAPSGNSMSNAISVDGTNTTSTGPTLWVVGDSTATSFSDTNYYSPRYGWGTQLGLYIKGINIQNLAVSGASSKSYVDMSQYQQLMQSVKSGDYVMIGFGHNDERAELGRYTNPNGSPSTSGSFQYYLYEKYIKPIRDKGANPILVTPIVRRNTGNNYTGESGHITTTVKNEEGTFEGGNYAKAICTHKSCLRTARCRRCQESSRVDFSARGQH